MQAIELAKQLFQNKEIRIFGTPQRPLFIASDVGALLKMKNVRATIATFEDYEKDDVNIIDTVGKKRKMTALTEAGLYSLIGKSRKPIAKEFKKWVNSDVLPSIRNTGKYDIQNTLKKQQDGILEDIKKEPSEEPEKQEISDSSDEKSERENIESSEEGEQFAEYSRELTNFDFDINDFTCKACVYLIAINKTDFKFGNSGDIDNRINTHLAKFRKLGHKPKVFKPWICNTMQIMRDTEYKIKSFVKQKEMFCDKYDQKEIITTTDIELVISKIDSYIKNQNNENNLLDKHKFIIKKIEVETRKTEAEMRKLQVEKSLENDNLRLQIEFYKLKMNIIEPKIPLITNYITDTSHDNITNDSDEDIELLKESCKQITNQVSEVNNKELPLFVEPQNQIIVKIEENDKQTILLNDKTEKLNKYDIARKWIENNLPKDEELSDGHFKRYRSEYTDCVPVGKFHEMVKPFGYERIKRTKGGNFWKKL